MVKEAKILPRLLAGLREYNAECAALHPECVPPPRPVPRCWTDYVIEVPLSALVCAVVVVPAHLLELYPVYEQQERVFVVARVSDGLGQLHDYDEDIMRKLGVLQYSEEEVRFDNNIRDL